MTVSELIFSGEFTKDYGNISIEIENIQRLSENINNHTLFFDLYSKKKNRSKELFTIAKSKPKAIITEHEEDFINVKTPVFSVKNVRRAYSFAYSAFQKINYSNLVFIGITGTNGKTTTASLLKSIFDGVGIKNGFIGTGKIISGNKVLTDINYSMTCPDPEVLYPAIKRIENDNCEIIIMEVSSHALALEKVAPIPFQIGIFTGLSEEHMDFHNNMESYFQEKSKLFTNTKKAIINYDDVWGRRLYHSLGDKAEGIGVVYQSDNYALEVALNGLTGSEYIYKSKTFASAIKLNIPGSHNIYNSMLAFAAARSLGLLPKDIRDALAKVTAIDGRCERISRDINIIIDYAHTPMALESLLKTVKSNTIPGQNIILVFGCGGDRDKSKRPAMAKTAEKYCDRIVVTNDNPRTENEVDIINDITRGFEKSSYAVIQNREKAIIYAITSASRGDYVIIAGKGHEKYINDRNGYHYFNERDVINTALETRERKSKNNENKA